MIRTISAALAVSLGLLAAGCGGDDPAGTAGADLKPIDPDGPRGAIELTQEGERISGTITLDGLEPGSAHAVHLHGAPSGDFSCAGEKTDHHLINFPDLVADEGGTAELAIDVAAPEGTLRAGTYVMAHENPRTPGQVATDAVVVEHGMAMSTGTDNPPIACADVPGGA